MGLLSLEQNKKLLAADFAFYGLLVAVLAVTTLIVLPPGHWGRMLGCVGAGALGWTLAEYLLHRFVLHGLQPFKGWHARHHAKPVALIATPTLLTAAGFALVVVAPAWWLAPMWLASALLLGVSGGYLFYIAMHHAVHHVHGSTATWLRQQQRRHALHHRAGAQGHYGVSTTLWDRLFRTAH